MRHPPTPTRLMRSALRIAIAFLMVGPQWTWGQSQQVLSGGGSKATITDDTGSPLRSPNLGAWQMPSSDLRVRAQTAEAQTAGTSNRAPLTTSHSAADSNSTQAGRNMLRASTPAPAAAAAKRTPLEPPSQSSGMAPGGQSGSTLQMILSVGSSLLIVLGLFLGVAWCYRKTLSSSLSGSLPKQVVQVVGRTPLAARQQLVLVRFGSKLVLVSMVQGEARTLSEITDPLEVDQLVGQCESARPGSITQSFRSVLHQGATS